MSTLLRLYLGESWPSRAELPWALLKREGSGETSLLQTGESDSSGWPVSEEMELLVSGAQMVWLRASLPEKLPRAGYAKVLANALEEKTIHEPEQQHLTVTARRAGEADVLVIARKRLQLVVEHFAALGRAPSGAYCELQTAPADADGWHLTLGADMAILRRHGAEGVAGVAGVAGVDGVALDLDPGDGAAPPPLLVALAVAAKAEGTPAPLLTVHAPSDSEWTHAEAWRKALGLEIRQGPAYRWHDIAAGADNLLHDEFAPSHASRAWHKRLKPLIWLAVAVMMADILLAAAQVGWQTHQLSVMQQRTAQLFQAAFPGTPLIDPPAQIRRQLEQQRLRAGLLRDEDALNLMAQLADALADAFRQTSAEKQGAGPSDAVQDLRFEAGVLEVSFSSTAAARLEAVQRQLAVRGLSSVTKTDSGGRPSLIIRAARAG